MDRGQYEILQDEDVPYSSEDVERLPLVPLQLDSTHNLDLFFSQIYEYHQFGGFAVITMNHVLSALKFVFLFFCCMELAACMKWDKVLDSRATISTWDDIAVPPAVCWASLPPFAALCLFLAILVFVYHLIRSVIALTQMWGVRRFCTIALDMPTSDSELNDLTWSEVLRRLLSVQAQMPICHTKVLDELDVYNRILRQTNYLIGMVNREVIPFRFHLPLVSSPYIYLPHYYLLNLKFLLFLGPRSPFASYSQLRPEYKFLTRRLELAAEMAKHSRIIGLIGLLLSPLVFLIQILLFLFSNAQRLRYKPAQLFYRSWSNYARLYLRHFNELPHEFDTRLNQAYKPATEYLDCFQSRFLSVVASHLVFTLGGLSILLFVISLWRESLIHLTGYLAAMAVGGLIANICVNFTPTEDAVHFPRASLLATLAKIHYMPDSWKDNPHAHKVRSEFSQLFQFRVVGAVEEILSPILVPLIMLFYIPRRGLDIVDFMRNFTTELDGVGDVCSFAQLDIPRHGDPEWCPTVGTAPSSPSSGDGGSDVSIGVRNLPAVGGKTELSLMHFHHTNPTWCLPPNSKAFLSAVRKQAFNDLQRHQRVQAEFIRGMTASTSPLFASLYAEQDLKTTTTMSAQQKPNQVYSSDFSVHAKNVAHVPTAMEQPSFGLTGALVESVVKGNTQTPNTETGTPAEVSSPTLPHQTERQSASKSAALLVTPIPIPFLGMAASGLYYNQQALYQPYMSQMEEKTTMNISYMSPGVGGSMSYGEFTADMDISSLYIHDLHQRRRNAHRLSQASTLLPYVASNLRQRSFTSDGLQEELRYQQPAHRYLGAAGRGRGLVHGVSVPASLRSARQFEGVVEEEADADIEEENTLTMSTSQQQQQQQQQTASASSSTVTTAVSPHILGDDVQKWPDLPPPTC
ncbi:Autophagy-related protein 9A [Taenia crassiceps]|uniref:Autophagy-related protein 9 n=1 Tax=Taenia crassiceps TaxID=6207 RepID=A0ABR4QPV2_9CEST